MRFFAFGLNHRTAPVSTRERFVLDAESRRALYRSLLLSEDAEVVLVSTCNRTEVYLFGTEADVQVVKAALSRRAGSPWPEARAFQYEDEAAVRHVLHVAAGLTSQVLGDAQILAQVREAYRLAVDEDRVGTVMHRLLHTAFRAAKRIISETSLTNGTASVASAAVAAAKAHLKGRAESGLEGCHVLLVGTGQMGCLALEALRSYRPASVTVTNRSPRRARELAAETGAAVVDWASRHEAISTADVVIVATGADAPVLWAGKLPVRCPHCPPALLIDIALPRNVDPAIDALPGYTVVDLDVLNARLVETEAQRQADVPMAQQLCEEALAEFVAWMFHQQALQPTIHAIRDTFEHIRRQEIERHHHRLAETDRAELDRLTQSIMQKLLAVPIVRLKDANPDSVDFVRGIQILHTLFSRSDEEAVSAGEQPLRRAPLSLNPTPGVEARCPFEGAAPKESGEMSRDALHAALTPPRSLVRDGERG